jgi:hypothetical protein
MTTESIHICGREFDIPVPDRYNPGEMIELTPGESSSIKQTFCENIRNNIAARMKKGDGEAINKDGDLHEELVDEWQTKVSEYATSYQFGVRAVGGGRGPSLDPETRIALSLIKEAVRANLRKKYGQKHGYSAEQVNEAAQATLDSPKGERFRRLAKQQMIDTAEAATDLLLPTAPDESSATAPAAA